MSNLVSNSFSGTIILYVLFLSYIWHNMNIQSYLTPSPKLLYHFYQFCVTKVCKSTILPVINRILKSTDFTQHNVYTIITTIVICITVDDHHYT